MGLIILVSCANQNGAVLFGCYYFATLLRNCMLQDNCHLQKASVCTNIYAPTITQNYFLPHNIPPERDQEHMWPARLSNSQLIFLDDKTPFLHLACQNDQKTSATAMCVCCAKIWLGQIMLYFLLYNQN